MANDDYITCPACGVRTSTRAGKCTACGAALDAQTRTSTEPLPTQAIEPGKPLDVKKSDVYDVPSPEFDVESLRVLSDRYKLVYKIARGGMGVIYLAEDTLLDNMRVAIKLLPPQLAPELQAEKRLKREALTAMSLSHDTIVRLFAYDQHAGQTYMVMEYVNGPTLMDLVESRGALPPAEVVNYAAVICEGLHYAHEKGVVHRDIKPANVMLLLPPDSPFVPPLVARGATPLPDPLEPAQPGGLPKIPQCRRSLSEMTHQDVKAGRIKICDFGIARQLKMEQTRLTGDSVIGSPVYMSPEQYRGEEVDHRSDIYSLGATAYELLAGHPPFDGPMHSLTFQILDKPAKPIKGLSEELNRVILKSLEKRPENRFADCLEFARVLRRALGDQQAPDVAVGDGPAAKKTAVSAAPRADDGVGAGDNFASQTQIARISFEAKLYDRALQELRDIHSSHGPKPELLSFTHECATQLVKKKKYDEAKMYCNYALQIEPRNPQTLVMIGRMERKLGHIEEAERNFRLAVACGGGPEAENELREILIAKPLGVDATTGVMSKFTEVTRMTVSMLPVYLLALVLCGALIFGAGLFAFERVAVIETFGPIIAAAAFLVLSAAGNTLLASAFAGPFDGFKDRLTRVKYFTTSQGYLGGWLMIGVIAAGILLAYSYFAKGAIDKASSGEFMLVFGLPCWLSSIFYSWFLMNRALRAPSPFE